MELIIMKDLKLVEIVTPDVLLVLMNLTEAAESVTIHSPYGITVASNVLIVK